MGWGQGGGVYGVYLPNHLSHYRSCLLPHYNIWLSIKKICHVSFLHRFQTKKIEMVYDFSFLKITKKMLCLCICCCVFCTACFGIFKCITIAHYVDFKVKKCAVFACIKTCHVQTAIIQMHRCLFRVLDAT